jgi:hypothetical protein
MSEEEKTPVEVNAQVTDAIDTSDVPVPETPAPAPEEKDVAAELPVANREVTLEEAASKSGIKDDATNEDAVKLASDEPEEAHQPSFFIEDDDLIRVELDILFDKAKGSLVSVSRKGLLDPKDFEILGYTDEWFDFKPPTYEEMSNYRQRASVFRQDAARQLVDPVALRNYLIVWHLKAWSMKDRNGKIIELTHEDKGALSDESIKAVYKLNPTLLDVVITLFEKDMMM